ncbi:MAG: TIGR02281 family clan AA aspartic protease [Rubrimonas sp.]|uniref:retropepsin-like aspartic protease family protein n=1 Tax=Rubrimonas sp. TaxID=2036015 RepID=UPI002FDD869A
MDGLDLEVWRDARVFYLSLLGLMLALGAFAAYRGRMSAALRHAAIWLLIFAGIVIAYRFNEQLTSGLRPQSMEVLNAQSVLLRREGDGHFHATLQINGRDIRFLVDTGATAMVLSRRDAQRAGLDPAGLNFSIPSATANGTVYGAPVRLSEVRLGPFTDRDVPAMVNGGELGVSLLGMRYLDRFARISVEGERMLLQR